LDDRRKVEDFINPFFENINMNNELYVLKDTLTKSLSDKLWNNISQGMDYDSAYDITVSQSGDIQALINTLLKTDTMKNSASFNNQVNFNNQASFNNQNNQANFNGAPRDQKVSLDKLNTAFEKRKSANYTMKILLAVIVYLWIGAIIGGWAWAWIIIPVTSITFSPINGKIKLIALSPFVYVMFGFLFGSFFWAWGWIIIPMMVFFTQTVV